MEALYVHPPAGLFYYLISNLLVIPTFTLFYLPSILPLPLHLFLSLYKRLYGYGIRNFCKISEHKTEKPINSKVDDRRIW
jgi:hypothetical protein